VHVQEWTDYRLNWNESSFGGLSNIVIPSKQMWTPLLLLRNK